MGKGGLTSSGTNIITSSTCMENMLIFFGVKPGFTRPSSTVYTRIL